MKINILWEKTDRIALGLSGGVDSIVLFHLLATEYKDTYKELVVFHINHGLRKESYEEAEFVEKFVKEYDVKFYKKELNMIDVQRDNHISEEMLARELRYNAFSEMAKKEQIIKILTAHHKNDQVENILMRILSGRSMDYNLAIEDRTTIANLSVLRPLLGNLKKDLEWYAKENNLKYFIDASNFDTDYTRNNIRHNIVPLLDNVNKASFDNLINFANYYQNVNAHLREKVLSEIEDYICKIEKDKVTFERKKLLSLYPEEIYFIFKDIFGRYFNIYNIKQKAIFGVIDALKGNFGNKSYDLKNNLKIVSEYDSIYIHKIEKKCYNDKIELIIDEIDEKKVYGFHQSKFLISASANFAEVGFNKEDLPLHITSRKNGDVVRRGNINKKLSRLFIDEKIPNELRDKLPVVRNKNEEVLGVLGIGTRVNKNKVYDYYIKMKG
ncbi:tRNA lysidine(34) synthetase TilS [Gemella cuniculi]|uniref:tRNA lysidine(34) synthetase TilS n=1 Tax=Gemella cuniculi TaxID=150240 RepID=UPI0004204F72|nr:tRNA lysidine(34) synthetase TilS [Gemella cuniculi]